MRTPIVAGNWKMHTVLEEAVALARGLRGPLSALRGVECVLCPPFISIAAVAAEMAGTPIRVGAQNCYVADQGAYTGEVSPRMLAALCQYVIVGHSERRQHFGEDDGLVNRKVHAVLRNGLAPIVCVGENLAQNEAGQTGEVVARQVRGALADVPADAALVIAYEPVWAIGTGRPATGADANRVAALVREVLADLYGRDRADAVRIQYGGSVNAKNCAEFFGQPEIDGALVGGASLKADEFVAIAGAAARPVVS
ncbi:MAG: triose-phosphate isomerase [Chloroflexi bacterium]|nr:triose-phosphate isomerase [Chloroflexota bacterium]